MRRTCSTHSAPATCLVSGVPCGAVARTFLSRSPALASFFFTCGLGSCTVVETAGLARFRNDLVIWWPAKLPSGHAGVGMPEQADDVVICSACRRWGARMAAEPPRSCRSLPDDSPFPHDVSCEDGALCRKQYAKI